MSAQRQGNLFEESAARACRECGESFVPDEDYHEFCNDCWERRQKRKPRPGEPNAAWLERMYGRQV